jgi:hypothetical protein
LNVPLWQGLPTVLFDGLLQWTSSGSGYVARTADPQPRQSVGFWIPDKPLKLCGDKYYYYERLYRLPFIGFQPTPDELPAGTLLRVSLARWWSHDADAEEKCFLQLSGYYDI